MKKGTTNQSMRDFLKIHYGTDVLVHQIGNEPDSSDFLLGLPDPQKLCTGVTYNRLAPGFFSFGMSFAESFFKYSRSSLNSSFSNESDVLFVLEHMPNEAMRNGFIVRLESFVEIALKQPERLPEIYRRIDALDNETLEEHCWQALCWEPIGFFHEGLPMEYGMDGGIFKGLMKGMINE